MERVPEVCRRAGTVAVAIPARDEAAHIGTCLAALAGQQGRGVDDIVVLVNNSSDATAAIARGFAAGLGARGPRVHVLECALPEGRAHAGWARRLAMARAACCLDGDGVLLCTDADGVADADWAQANLAAIAAGAEAVAGWVELDPADAARIPARLHADDAREMAYDALCDEIHATLDPDPDDPLPRHTQDSGASIAVTLAAYRRAGGMPPLAAGEDRGFLRALRRVDARIRHAPECHVTVSGRLVGRAANGMADTIRRRLSAQDLYIDDRLEPAAACARRALLRQRLRQCRRERALLPPLARRLGLAADTLAGALTALPFGAVWEMAEMSSPVLQRRRVAVRELERETARAAAILRALRDRRAACAPAIGWAD